MTQLQSRNGFWPLQIHQNGPKKYQPGISEVPSRKCFTLKTLTSLFKEGAHTHTTQLWNCLCVIRRLVQSSFIKEKPTPKPPTQIKIEFGAKDFRNNLYKLSAHFLGNIPVTTTTKIFPKVLRYKWEAYCNTNGRRTAIQMGGVLTVFPFP